MSSASIQKLFCGIYSTFKCSFDEFVGEKVFSPSYSSAILAPPSETFTLHTWDYFIYGLNNDQRRNKGFLGQELPFWRQYNSIQYHSNPSLCPKSNAEEAEVERFYEDLQDLLELTPKKDVLCIIQDWNAEVGSQETPGVMGKFSLGIRNEAGQSLIEFCQENTLVIANTLFQQHKRRLYTWTSPDGQHRHQTDYILCSQRWRSSIQSAKTRSGADCG